VKRYALYGLGFVGALSLTAGIWHLPVSVAASTWLEASTLVGTAAPAVVAEGSLGPAFLISAGVFLLVFAAISLRWMHETAAALLGAVIVWLVSYVGGTFFAPLRILNFEESMIFVDWNVIFLILGMMIFMAMFSDTGVFGWLAYRAFRLARGNAWLLGMVLVLLTGVTPTLSR
jgi:di/tricarboxylate transporter